MDRWLVLELGPHADGEDPDLIRRSIQRIVRGAEVFIPAVVTEVGTNRDFQYVIEGYAFVRLDRSQAAFLQLENSRYVQSILTDASKGFATVPDTEIAKMRARIQKEVDQDINVGDTVLITAGVYRGIQGRVIEDLLETKSVQVYVQLRSKEAILTLPRSFLKLISRMVRPKLFDLLPAFQQWASAAKVLAAWDSEANQRLVQVYESWAPLEYLRSEADLRAEVLLAAHKLPLDTTSLSDKAVQWFRLYDFNHQYSLLTELVRIGDTSFDVPLSLTVAAVPWFRLAHWAEDLAALAPVREVEQQLDVAAVATSVLRYVRLHDFFRTWNDIVTTMHDIGVELTRLEDRMLDNVLVDGFNLAFRCRFAPSLRDLKDKQGRPTGVIFGFVRSLAALQKRFPKAALHVCWDGSSKRRKAAFEGYKSNRPQRGEDGFDQIGFLRGFLPLVGVTQHWNPDEEADDVIATLVRGPMLTQRNVIVSTDRDLLQLVGHTTIVLTPAVGAGKEHLFDEDAVVAEYGVEPDKLPHLRAMMGDASDNLPGVVRVPAKILAALVRSHGTVEGIYSSGLPGLTKVQYAKLKEAEEQVRVNVGLMLLRDDVDIIRTEPNPDQIAANARLGDVDINPEAITAFFGGFDGFIKEAP